MPVQLSDTKGSNGAIDNQLPSYDEISEIELTRQWLKNPLPRRMLETASSAQSAISRPSRRILEAYNFFVFSLASGSNPTLKKPQTIPLMSLEPQNYTFVIRGGLYAIATVRVSHTTPHLKAVLCDAHGGTMLEIQKQAPNFADPLLPSVNFIRRGIRFQEEKTVQKFDVMQGGRRVGVISFCDKEPIESSLKIFRADGSTPLVVRSMTMGEFSVYRDKSSPYPLCNIRTHPNMKCFSNTIQFYPTKGIMNEERKLCVAATFAYKMCKVQHDITSENKWISSEIIFLCRLICFFLLCTMLFVCWKCWEILTVQTVPVYGPPTF